MSTTDHQPRDNGGGVALPPRRLIKRRESASSTLKRLHRVLRAQHSQTARLQEEQAVLKAQHQLLVQLMQFFNDFKSSFRPEGGQHAEDDHMEAFLLQQAAALQVPGDSSIMCSNSCGSDGAGGGTSSATSSSSADSGDEGGSSCAAAGGTGGVPHPRHRQPQAAGGAAAVGGGGGASTTTSSSNRVQRQVKLCLDQPAAPPDDPFRMMRLAVQQPINLRAVTMTLQELQQMYARQMHELQPLVAQIQQQQQQHDRQQGSDAVTPAAAAAAAAAIEAALQRIRALQVEWFGINWSLRCANREQLYFQMHVTNWQTGASQPAPCKAQHAALLQQLGLSAAQLRALGVGAQVFKALIGRVVAQRRAAHTQGLVLPQRPAGVAACALAAAAGAPAAAPGHTSGGGCGVEAVSAAYSQQGAQLQAQQEQSDRLAHMGRKDSWLRACSTLYVQGCLTWLQQARLRLLMTPYHFNAGIFFACLEEQQREQRAQQQEQQQEEQEEQQQQHSRLQPSSAAPAAGLQLLDLGGGPSSSQQLS